MLACEVHPQALALAFREQSRASIGFDISPHGVPKPKTADAGTHDFSIASTHDFSIPIGNSHSVA